MDQLTIAGKALKNFTKIIDEKYTEENGFKANFAGQLVF